MSERSPEHRFLSVLFCDMADSTGHQYRIGSERYAELLSTYRTEVFAVVRRHGGHVAEVIGDGILAYFGWPRAAGHDARAAVSCGLEVGDRMAQLGRRSGPDAAVAVRIAIETGWVLAGARGPAVGSVAAEAERGRIVGHALNVASRLQRLARPNGVVAGEVTLSLLGDLFEVEPVNTYGLSLPAPVRAAHVTRQSNAGDVLRRMGRQAALVGRKAQLQALRDRWDLAKAGAGQVVLLAGEPGIGKSRLAASMIESVEHEAHVVVLTCSPAMANSVLQPFIEPVRLAAGLTAHAGPEAILTATQALAARFGIAGGASALAALLGAATPDTAPANLRQGIFAVLLNLADRLAADRPLLVLAEDVHWADASTLELVRRRCETTGQRIMLLATHRSGWEPAWPDGPNLSSIKLAPLTAAAAAQMVTGLTGELDPRLQARIVAQAEGNPLFLEEFARATTQPGSDPSRLPGSISQLLTARLDSVETAHDLVQCACVVGREMDVQLLTALVGHEPAALEAELNQLLDNGIMVRRTDGEGTKLAFRHRLLANAGYDALTAGRRQALHRQVAATLRSLRPNIETLEPEELGRHYALAGDHGPAAAFYRSASANALGTAAFAEATAHARRAIELAGLLAGEERQRALLDATVLLGEALSGPLGYASAEVHKAFETASRIALELGSMADLLPALRGLTAYYQIRGPMDRAHELGRRAVQVAQLTGDTRKLAEAERRLGWCLFCQGKLEQSRRLVQGVMDRLKQAPGPASAAGDDSTVRGPVILALVAWMVEGDKQALAITDAMAVQAAAFPRPMTKVYGLGFASFLQQLCGNFEAAHRLATMSGQLAGDRRNPYWVSLASIVCGWAEVVGQADRTGRGLDRIRRGLKDYEDTQSTVMHPYGLLLLAEAEGALGDASSALDTLERALAVSKSIGAEFYVSIVQMRRGMILRNSDPAAARAAFASGRVAAQAQGAYAQMKRIDAACSGMKS